VWRGDGRPHPAPPRGYDPALGGGEATNDSLTPFRERPFRLLFASRSVSVLGDNVAPIALAFAVLGIGGDASDLGFVLAARAVPLVLFVLAGGVWADRLPRRQLMVAADCARALTQGAMAFLLLTGSAQLWHLVALSTVHGFASAFYRPASTGLTPQTVRRDYLQQANSLLFLSLSFSNIFGPIIGGVLVATVGAGWGIAVDAASFAISALLLVPLRVKTPIRAKDTFFADLRTGWREVRARKWLWVSIVDFAVFQIVVLSVIYVLGPVIADDRLGGASAWASIATGLGAGLVLGSILALRFRPLHPLTAAFAVVIAVAPALVVLGSATPTATIVAAMVPAGVSLALAQTLWSTVLQRHIPDHALSRVSSYDWIGSTALRPVGYAIVGPVAVVLGTSTTLYAAAGLIVVFQLAALSVRELRELPPAPPPSDLGDQLDVLAGDEPMLDTGVDAGAPGEPITTR
jgi:MFS family permease